MQSKVNRQNIVQAKRRKRNSPFHSVKLRVIPAGPSGFTAPSMAFPGQPPVSPRYENVLLWGSLFLALLLHASVVALLVLSGQWIVAAPEVETVIPIELIKIKPSPLPRARAERRPLTPADVEPPPPVPRAPRALNRAPRQAPTVAQAAAPTVTQPSVDELAPQALALRDVAEQQSPQEVQEVTAQRVHVAGAVTTVPTQVAAVDSNFSATTGSPSLRVSEGATVGSTETSGGPTAVGGGVLTGEYGAPGGGPSTLLRDGIVTHRDVIGVEDAAPLPMDVAYKDVVLATGDANATGTGQAGGVQSCSSRPEVLAYSNILRKRVERELTGTVVGTEAIKYKLKLNTDGTIQGFELLTHRDTDMGLNVQSGFYAASPFPPMPQAVRCMAKYSFTGKYPK